jgi:hypothetical protein
MKKIGKKSFLSKYPKIMYKYVAILTKMVEWAFKPIKKLMEHLILVQNVSLDTVPGEGFRRALADGLNYGYDERSCDSDFDFNRFAFLRDRHSPIKMLRKLEPILEISRPVVSGGPTEFDKSEINLANNLDKLLKAAGEDLDLSKASDRRAARALLCNNLKEDHKPEECGNLKGDHKSTEKDLAAWTGCFEEAAKDPDFKVFVHPAVKITKTKKRVSVKKSVSKKKAAKKAPAKKKVSSK